MGHLSTHAVTSCWSRIPLSAPSTASHVQRLTVDILWLTRGANPIYGSVQQLTHPPCFRSAGFRLGKRQPRAGNCSARCSCPNSEAYDKGSFNCRFYSENTTSNYTTLSSSSAEMFGRSLLICLRSRSWSCLDREKVSLKA